MPIDEPTELDRLAAGRCADAPPPGYARYEIDVESPGAARDVLSRTTEVLSAVVRAAGARRSAAAGGWEAALPEWFVRASGPDLTPDEERARMARLDALPPAERDAERARHRWSVNDFVYWFAPPLRQWWWWGAEVLDADRLRVCLAAEEVSFPREALEWLLRAAGAVDVVDEDEREFRRRAAARGAR